MTGGSGSSVTGGKSSFVAVLRLRWEASLPFVSRSPKELRRLVSH